MKLPTYAILQILISLVLCLLFSSTTFAADAQWLTYKGTRGPGKGKTIVFVTGDEEYRSEESMPAMARILAQRHGFTCIVLFSVDPNTGEINPKIDNNIPGLDALKTADLMVVFMRFRHLPPEQMSKFVDYVNSGRPIIGIRTATHAFDYDKFQKEEYSKWAWRGPHPDFAGGFGRQVLGETWIDHYGGYHSESTLGEIVPAMKNHPILRGIDRIWGPSHTYKVTTLNGDSQPLVMGQPLKGLKPDDKPDPEKPPLPVAWVKTFTGTSGKPARVFTTTYGDGDDFKQESIRRMFVNACYWCVGLEDKIPARSDVRLVGTYAPQKSNFGAWRRGVTPADLQENLSTDDLADVPENDREADYYRIVDVPMPSDTVMEAGSILSLPDGRLVVGTRRGEVYFATGAEATPPAPQWKLFASGLTEVLGLAWRDGVLYATQQGEITRLLDTRHEGRADRYETVSDAWGWAGEHEFTFGSNFGPDGAIWTAHCLTGSYTSDHLFRGWVMRTFPDGRSEPMCSGLRSPGGIAFNSAGDVFCTDNQGTWNGACTLKHLKPGSFQGNPESLKWYDHAPNMIRPSEPPIGGESGRDYLYARRAPQFVPPAIVFPYKKMGQSASAVMLDQSNGKFGPFAGQFFVADYTLSVVMRTYLEKVNGVYQGACFPFRQGLSTGLIGGTISPGGKLFVGGSNRGWPSRGLSAAALQRIDWTGKTPFEVREMHVTPDGFDLRFTEPVDAKSAADPESYSLRTFTYYYHAGYGSPEIEAADQRITSIAVSADGLSARLVIDKLVAGHVHELHMPGVTDRAGQPLLHDVAYYTLNQIPKP
ncbi:MAG TPA: ThuA domain-containing protein [Tepidisphaeraceae bacterium]|nr:ThuA domain-containing protein [Tepidisphaeraceae bacterium]